MIKQRCLPCNGSGFVMGGGMLTKECDDCDGNGYYHVDERNRTDCYLLTSTQHEEIKTQVLDKFPGIPEEEVEQLINTAMSTENAEPKKRGRPKR